MATTAARTVVVSYTGDTVATERYAAVANTASPGGINAPQSLSNGNNTITVPAVTGIVPTAVVIIPAAGNTNAITFKGVNGDTGVRLHNTDPTVIALDPSVTTFVLNAAGATIVRLVWM